MGHSSIQVTVDVHGHLIPGANTAWADALDSATQPQPTQETGEEESLEVVELFGSGGEDRTPDLGIMRL